MSKELGDAQLESLGDPVLDSDGTDSSSPKSIESETLDSIKILLSSQAPKGQETPKQIGLSFKDLSVSAQSGTEIDVKTLPRAVLNTFGPDQIRFVKENILARIFPNAFNATGRPILVNFTGIVKPGEMLLVLGRPGSGCSTFLRTVANQSTLTVTGDLEYANVPASIFKRDHARETIYLPEEDRHIASLSVRQAIRFALRTSLPPETRNSKSVANLVEGIAKLFGLSHALDTPVGGPFFPGVSGGERKRLVLWPFSKLAMALILGIIEYRSLKS